MKGMLKDDYTVYTVYYGFSLFSSSSKLIIRQILILFYGFCRLIIEKLGICALSMEEVHGMGIKEAVKYALNMIDPRSQRNIHISFDIDALDPLEAPSTGTPVRGGLTLREGKYQ